MNRLEPSMTESNIALKTSSVVKRFGSHTAVDNVDLEVGSREFVSLLGPSGCGKTSLLRLIAGFLRPDAGTIVCQGKDITNLPPYARNLGVVFQNYALFPHMTAAENVGYGLKIRRVAKAELDERVRRALDRVNLSQAAERYPLQLSGGMQQRVALARALVIEPSVLLLDEPLSALDKHLREDMQGELRLLQKRIGVTTIFVTHDQEEAMTLSDRIAVMEAGKIRQMDTPENVYKNPVSRFVATFLGTTNMLTGSVAEANGSSVLVDVHGLKSPVQVDGQAPAPGAKVNLAIRPEQITLSKNGSGIPGTVREVLYQGHRNFVIFDAKAGGELRCFAPSDSWSLDRGDEAFARWADNAGRILPD